MGLFNIILKDKHVTSLKEGQKAPYFKGRDENGREISLDDFKGKKLLLYFYPKDDTSGCTAQSRNLRDSYDAFLNKGYAVVGVSADDEASHQAFKSKYSLPYPLIADTEHQLIKAYDVWGKKLVLGAPYEGIIRTTFIISEEGIIEKIITEVDTANHAEQVLA